MGLRLSPLKLENPTESEPGRSRLAARGHGRETPPAATTLLILYHTMPYYAKTMHIFTTLLYSTLRYPTLLYPTLPCSTLLYPTLPYSTLLYSTILYSDITY